MPSFVRSFFRKKNLNCLKTLINYLGMCITHTHEDQANSQTNLDFVAFMKAATLGLKMGIGDVCAVRKQAMVISWLVHCLAAAAKATVGDHSLPIISLRFTLLYFRLLLPSWH